QWQTTLCDGRSHGLVQRAFDVGRADRLELVEIPVGLADVGLGGVDVIIAERANVRRKVDETKAILRTKRREQLAAGGARLLDLATLHRSGDVEHERDVARRWLGALGRRWRQCDERE